HCVDWLQARRRSSGGGIRSGILTSPGVKHAAPSPPATAILQWHYAKIEQRAVCAERCTYGSGRSSAQALRTPLPMSRGYAYLTAIMDVYSRRILSWRVSNTLDTRFCIEALDEALRRHGPPEIFNTDQGSQFTSLAFTSVLENAGVRISMDGKGRWADNVFI